MLLLVAGTVLGMFQYYFLTGWWFTVTAYLTVIVSLMLFFNKAGGENEQVPSKTSS